MKTLILLVNLFFTFCFYISFGSNASMFDSDPFEIYPVGNIPSTTNGNVARFSITNSTTWDVMLWGVNTDRCVVTNSQGSTTGASLEGQNLYVVFKNIKINKTPHNITCLASWGMQTFTDGYTVPGFTLVMPTPTFASGSSLNIPCYITTAQINLNDYKNVTGLSAGLEITDEFEWTLPSGWQTSSSQTGTFVAGKTINLILPSSNSPGNITVRAKAYDQYSASATLVVTRNLESFSIVGPATATCYSTKRYTAPATPSGVSYTWQLPTGWSGVITQNYIDVTVTGSSGSITCTMTGCGQIKSSTKAVTVNIVEPGTAISGPDLVCPSGSSYSIPPMPGGTVTWTQSSLITRVSPQGSNPCIFSTNAVGTGWIEATVNTSCGSITLPRKNVTVGGYRPEFYGLPLPGYPLCAGSTNNVYCSSSPGGNYYWEIFGGTILSGQRTNNITYSVNALVPPNTSGSVGISVTVNGGCNTPVTEGVSIPVIDCSGGGTTLVFSPNPTSGETTLTIETKDEEETFNRDTIWDLEIYSELQTLKSKQTRLRGKSAKIQTLGWKEGVYLVRVKYNDKVLAGKLVVK